MKKETLEVKNLNGATIDFAAAAALMDDDIREAIARDLAPCAEQEFFTAYERAHAIKFGEAWELSSANPTW